MKLFPIVFVLLAVAAGEAHDGICNSQQTPTTKLIARRTWPRQTATTMTTTTAQPTTVTTTSSSTTTTTQPSTVSTTEITTTNPTTTATTLLPIRFSCPVSKVGCQIVCTNLTSRGGVVQSRNFPDDYGYERRDCFVTIIAPEEWLIQLKFTTFNLETDVGFVQVKDSGSLLMDSATGNIIPVVVPTTTNEMKIIFSTVASSKPDNAVYNWQATFSLTTEGSSCSVQNPARCGNVCANVTSAGTGVVQSPTSLPPGDDGDGFRDCFITIVVPTGKRIRLEFTKFHVATTEYGEVYVSERRRLIYPGLSGSQIPEVVTSRSNIMYVSFTIEGRDLINSTIYNWQAAYTAVTA